MEAREYKSFYKVVGGNEGGKCPYNARLDTYGCGCGHDCKYCYAKSLLSFRGLWHPDDPSIANIGRIERVIKKLPPGTIVRLGGMTDCFQPLEARERVTLQTIGLLNRHGIGYLIVTKSHTIAGPEYLAAMDRRLAHIQVSVTSLDDSVALGYERASPPRKRIEAVMKLQENGFDTALRVSPVIPEYMDFDALNVLDVSKCIIEFLRVNSWIRRWLPGIDYTKYTLRHCNYHHLPLPEKLGILEKIRLPGISVCEDVTEHYEYWRDNVNPNKQDCCNLNRP